MKRAIPFLLVAYGALSAARAPAAQPNILFIAVDDLRDGMHYLGYTQEGLPTAARNLATPC